MDSMNIPPIFTLGPIEVTVTVITTWGIMVVLGVMSWLLTRQLSDEPGTVQTALEGIVSTIERAIAEVSPQNVKYIMPFIGSLWVFLVVANLSGLIPGVNSPTRDLSATSALALLVFLSTHWFGVRIEGWKNYLQHYIKPSPILLPFHLISEITRTFALAVRLFGNIMSLEMAALMVLLVAGFLAPIPIMVLHIIEALVQAYIFGMLALIYVAGGLQSHQLRQQEKE